MNSEFYSGQEPWQAYAMKCGTSFLVRNGLVACGLTHDTPYHGDEIFKKPEFVAEHEGRAAFLYCVLALWSAYSDLPDLYGLESGVKVAPDYDLFGKSLDPKIIFFLLFHDIGEVATGDALDDGSGDYQKAKERESWQMDTFLHNLPFFVSNELGAYYDAFEDYGKNMVSRHVDAEKKWKIMFAKAVDKAEAVAFQLFLATKGLVGDITYKKPPSERDLRFAKILGTNRAPDIYALHFRIVTKHMPTELLTPINYFLKAGFRDAFMEIPECLTIDVSNLELD